MAKDIGFCTNMILELTTLPIAKLEVFDECLCSKQSGFLNDRVALDYIYNLNRNIDASVGKATKELITDKIVFKDDMDVRRSFCESITDQQVIKELKIYVPHIKSGLELLITAHELGHGISQYSMLDNQRKLHNDDAYSEFFSMLFAQACKERYEFDFGFDDQVKSFEEININNVINCLNNAKEHVSKFQEVKQTLDTILSGIPDPYSLTGQSYYENTEKLNCLKGNILNESSYIIGLSTCNMYDEFSDRERKDWWKFIGSIIDRDRHIDYNIIEQYLGTEIDSKFCSSNIVSYVKKYKTKKERGTTNEL